MANPAMVALVAAWYYVFVTADGTFLALATALVLQFTLTRRFSVLAKAAQRVSAGEPDLEIKSKPLNPALWSAPTSRILARMTR